MDKNDYIIRSLNDAIKIVESERKTYLRIADTFRLRGDEHEASSYEWQAYNLDDTILGLKYAIMFFKKEEDECSKQY